MELLTIKTRDKPAKKLMAVHIGSRGMDDYTITKDKKRQRPDIRENTATFRSKFRL